MRSGFRIRNTCIYTYVKISNKLSRFSRLGIQVFCSFYVCVYACMLRIASYTERHAHSVIHRATCRDQHTASHTVRCADGILSLRSSHELTYIPGNSPGRWDYRQGTPEPRIKSALVFLIISYAKFPTGISHTSTATSTFVGSTVSEMLTLMLFIYMAHRYIRTDSHTGDSLVEQ